ncbi:MAG: DUF58 domain-containing protein [Pyrinomonadaceae bacterium]|nr:DUF58 domain-containing protein [Pyrinomonadaceae bacterium]
MKDEGGRMNPQVNGEGRRRFSSFRLHPSNFSRGRNAFFGTLLVLAGLAAALVSVLARQTNDSRLTTAGALLSLIIAGLILIFIVPSLARSARLEMTGLDLPIEVTAGGAIFIAIVSIVALAAWNTGNNLLFLVFALLCSTLFVGWIAARTSLRDLVVSARFPDHIFAGEPAPAIVTLRNTKRVMPSFSVLVEARGPMSSKAGEKRKQHHKRALAYFTYVPHGAAAEQRVEQLFPERGYVFINGFELSTRFPFGFLRRRRRLKARNVDIVVYPKPEPIGDELHLLPMYAGRIASMRRGAGHDLFSLRDYQAQDDLRHIDWKATARARRLTVREFTSEDERRITLMLDTRTVPDSELGRFQERFERGVIRAASHLKHFIDEGAEVRLILGTDVGPSGSGLEHLYQCLRRLALVSPDPATAAAEIEGDHRSRSVSGDGYSILLTTAAPGSIPAKVWRSSYVIYL